MCSRDYHLVGEVALDGVEWRICSHASDYPRALDELFAQVPAGEGGQLLYVGFDWAQSSCPDNG